ncbi:MAG: beta-propeller domain-containing protein [Oscillospiraceae bacterium]|nr:beta-propeller domain-containing protein [Oscillospiraceae bacterium]
MRIKKIIAALLTAIMAFSLLPAIIGAADEALTTADALIVLRHTAGTATLNASQLSKYDVNKDSKVDSADALFILQIVAGIRNSDGTFIPILNSSGNYVASSYEDIYNLVSSNRDNILGNNRVTVITEANAAEFATPSSNSAGGGGGGGGSAGGGAGAPAPSDAPASSDMVAAAAPEPRADGAYSADDFSDTNNQVAGVQEGDIIKTDGRNIYLASPRLNNVNVIKADNGNMQRIALLEKENATPVELLLYNNDLIIVWGRSTRVDININTGERSFNRRYYQYETIVEVYDVNGQFNQPISTYVQDGSYNSSRMIDNIIYLITNYMPNMQSHFTLEDYSDYVPTYAVNHKEFSIAPNSIVIAPENLDYISYTVISGLDVTKENMLVSIKASLEITDVIYSSHENIYITSQVYERANNHYWEEYLVINKFSINKGQIEYVAATKLRGNIRNQFYLDEHRGTLRVVTQVWGRGENGWWGSSGGSLYTLDRSLRTLDEVHGIGGIEEVHSVRFAGDIGYIVTFLNTDPLFSFDLSDPTKIIQLDELKIPGFSRYMHKWSDDLLLGVGVDADEQTGRRTGLKLSMFDIADNENLAERHVYVIGAGNSGWFWSIAEHEHRAILVSPEKNIIAFPYEYEFYFPSSRDWEWGSAYAIFSYDEENGFTLIGEIKDERNRFTGFQRGLFIGDYIYAASDNKVVSAHIRNAEVVQTFSLTR